MGQSAHCNQIRKSQRSPSSANVNLETDQELGISGNNGTIPRKSF